MKDFHSTVDLDPLLSESDEHAESTTMSVLTWLWFYVSKIFVIRTERPLRGDVRAYLPTHLRDPRNCGGVILFDGVCNLCDGTMHFVHRRDPGWFAYGQIQSEVC